VGDGARTGELAPGRRWGWASPARIAVLLVAFALLAVLVEAGALTRGDQFALDHLMPALHPESTSGGSVTQGLYRPFRAGTSPLWEAVDLWTYPCSVIISGLVMATALVVSWRRSRLAPALAIAAAWVVGNAVELAGKGVIRRPALYGSAHGVRIHVTSFDNSFPSGHMIRGTLLVAAIGLLWPRARWVLLPWAVLVAPALVVSSAHTPSDVLGGLLMGLALIGGAAALAASPALERASSSVEARLSPQRWRRGATEA
jgi:membrane-associated phospholipid phosphatase